MLNLLVSMKRVAIVSGTAFMASTIEDSVSDSGCSPGGISLVFVAYRFFRLHPVSFEPL